MHCFGNRKKSGVRRDIARQSIFQRGLKVEVLERRHLMAVLTVTNTDDLGAGSLRAAMETANDDSASDEIRFNIAGSGVHTINLASDLPFIFTPMLIDGWSQPGFTSKPIIKLQDGNGVGYGLQILDNDSTVRGLIFSGFNNSQLAIWGGDQNKVQGNYFGTNDAATALDGLPTTYDAVFIGDGSVGNVIGVDGDGVNDALERNIIGGGQSGVGMWGADTTGNRIAGNYIGTNAALLKTA